nr:MAG TPA: hypothetical protein [Caudoviricetes sp.]
MCRSQCRQRNLYGCYLLQSDCYVWFKSTPHQFEWERISMFVVGICNAVS